MFVKTSYSALRDSVFLWHGSHVLPPSWHSESRVEVQFQLLRRFWARGPLLFLVCQTHYVCQRAAFQGAVMKAFLDRLAVTLRGEFFVIQRSSLNLELSSQGGPTLWLLQ